MKFLLQNLTKIFPGRGRKSREEVAAVRDFSFEIPDGALAGLSGPSGCGKSTTLNLISGLEQPTEGRIFFGEEDVTDLLGKDGLIDHQNKFVTFKGLTVEAAGQDESGADVPFLYNWDGYGQNGNDLYFKASLDGETYTFTVESYLCDNTTNVYAEVKNLQIGDKIDMEGFLYWYEGVNPHITSVTAAK